MVTQAERTNSSLSASDPIQRDNNLETACADLIGAMNEGKIGDIVAKHETLILHYYKDVQDQAKQSFGTAKSVSKIGFWVLISTLAYVLIFDALSHFRLPNMTGGSLTVAGVGVASGILIEFIAGVSFWLYSRGARQFGAFHICLERTHRYLLAYKIAEQIGARKDETLRDLVCMMANAPMITRKDFDVEDVGPSSTRPARFKVVHRDDKAPLGSAV